MNTNVEVKLTSIGSNPYRDLTMFPINDTVLKSLVESIHDTDFWDNLVLRLENNSLCDGTPLTSRKELDALFESGHDFSAESFELCYGHHRVAALAVVGREMVNLPVKFVSDENMLKMMANENKDSNQNVIAIKLETTRQVKASIEETLAAYETFAAYKKDGGKLYTNKQGFNNAKENGVGFKVVKKFLGETWSETDIRYSFAVLAAIDAGYFLQEDIIEVPSIGLLEVIGGISGFLMVGDEKKELTAPDWPMFFKTQAIDDIIERCKVDSKGWQKVTVAQLRKAKSLMVNEGINPASYVKSGNVKNAFDIVKATKELIFDKDKDESVNLAALEDLREKDGFSDYHDLDELLKRVGESVKKSLARGTDTEEAPLEPVEGDELEKQIAEADGEVAVPDMFAAGDIDADGQEAPIPVAHLIAAYTQTVSHMQTGTLALTDRLSEVGDDEALDMAAIELLKATASFVFVRLGKDSLIDVFNSTTK